MRNTWKLFWGLGFIFVAVAIVLDALGIFAPFVGFFGEVSIWAIIGGALLLCFAISQLISGNIGNFFVPLALIFMIFARLRVKNRFIFTFAALILTLWFGVLTSLVDIGLFSGFFENFWQRFAVYYLRGIPFYAAQLVCNVVLFLLLFEFLIEKLEKVKRQFI